ncbi:G patch domain-containing protein 4 [Panicum miliaceum]|uniref:G patch domain-containing protein 4 n=1 Tax=Panicum miliaceum TaxID=4540 RepID=A0A3L6SJJ1_PANMI|nr:G patch domain-containing protein 4 [Panicum miliaceum]
MRAITGAVVSSEPCPLPKAFCILKRFYNSAAPNLPSADCATYLHTVAEATREHGLLRRGLHANLQQGASNLEAYDYEGERKHQDRERKGDAAVPTGGSNRDSAAEVELDAAAGEKKSKKKKNKEDRQQGRAVAGVESHTPSSPEIVKEKRKEKHSIKEIIASQEPVDEELLSEKKSKKKKEKVRVKLEEEVRDANEVGGKIVNDGGLEQNVAGGEKKRKKKKSEEEVNSKDVKQEEKMVSDGDLDSEKKRKKKRGRGDNDDNMLDQVEHTKKKQRK